MWVEKFKIRQLEDKSARHPPCEDVSWKVYILLFATSVNSHPPCEDVSWKAIGTNELQIRISHPPCEDVSWKTRCLKLNLKMQVILLVRMWVEKNPAELDYQDWVVILLVRMWVEKSLQSLGGKHPMSSSLWGCELKICPFAEFSKSLGHPPCEDVSWKAYILYQAFHKHVILLVRMWVEKSLSIWETIYRIRHPPCEDVSWKTLIWLSRSERKVILLVRMWVEKT